MPFLNGPSAVTAWRPFFRKGKIFTGFNRKILPLVVDNSLAFKGKDKGFTGGSVFRKARSGTEAHDDEFHLRRLDDVAVDDFTVLAGDEIGQRKEFFQYRYS